MMKKLILLLFLVIYLGCSKNENSNIPVTEENVVLSQSESYEYELQFSGDESGFSITKQAKNFEISEIDRIDNNLNYLYTYQPKSGFVGLDCVEISLSNYAIGPNTSSVSQIIRINFEVQK